MVKIKHRNAGVYEFLRSSLDLAEVVEQEAVSELVKSSEGYRTLCPIVEQESRNPAFTIYDVDQRWYCYSCRQGGDVVGFWRALHELPTMLDAAQHLARAFDLELPSVDPKVQMLLDEQRAKEELAAGEARTLHTILLDPKRGKKAREYFEGRGFDKELQERFVLGSTQDGKPTIPFWAGGRIHGNVIRNYDPETPKYKAPSNEDFPLGRRPLFMVEHPRAKEYLLVEGFFDGLAGTALGIPTIGTGGAAPSKEQIADLRRLGEQGATFYVFPDNDERGQEAAQEAAEELYPYARLMSPYGQFKDLTEMFQAMAPGEVQSAIKDLKAEAVDSMQYWTQEHRVPSDARAMVRHLVEKIVPLIRQLTSEAERQAVIKDVAARIDGLNQDIVRQAVREVEAQHLVDQEEDDTPEIPKEEYLHLLLPGVADRYVEDVCALQSVVGDTDRKVVKAGLLSVAGSQLAPLPTGKPVGSSIMLTGPSGRGKNYLLDASVYAAPPSWFRAFTVASAQAFYWAAELDPAFLKHKFIYPNEKEAVDSVIEFLRPMLSQGSAEKFVTNKDDSGKLTFQRIAVEGPITGAIPTIRNTLDDQLQNRLLIIELTEYKGRNPAQTRALSKQYTLERLVAPDQDTVDKWRAALASLTATRTVVIPYAGRDEFCLDSDEVETGPRLWANLLGLLCANAFLEQHNRERTEHARRTIIHANAEDYRVAYDLIRDLARRSLGHLGETHKKIVAAVHALREESGFPEDGFSVTEIAQKAGVSKGTVSKNRAYLTRSVGILYETESGKLNIPAEATPTWWESGEVMSGFPTPEEVKAWEDGTAPPDDVVVSATEDSGVGPVADGDESLGRVVYAGKSGPGYDRYVGDRVYRTGHERDYFFNPYHTEEDAAEKFREYLHRDLLSTEEGRRNLEALRGRTLGCWCASKNGIPDVLTASNPAPPVCHAQVLLQALKDVPPSPDSEKRGNTETAAETSHKHGKSGVSGDGNGTETFPSNNLDARVYEVFATYLKNAGADRMLRSLWKSHAKDAGIDGRQFAGAIRRLEKAGRVEGREYAGKRDKDRYYSRPDELGDAS